MTKQKLEWLRLDKTGPIDSDGDLYRLLIQHTTEGIAVDFKVGMKVEEVIGGLHHAVSLLKRRCRVEPEKPAVTNLDLAQKLEELAEMNKTAPEDYYGGQFWDYDDLKLLKDAAAALRGSSAEPSGELRAPAPHDPLCRIARGGSCNCRLAAEPTREPLPTHCLACGEEIVRNAEGNSWHICKETDRWSSTLATWDRALPKAEPATERPRFEVMTSDLMPLAYREGWPLRVTVEVVEGAPKLVWMDRIIYSADGMTKRVERQQVPEGWCRHDDGDCHEDDPCANCPKFPLNRPAEPV